MGLQGNLAAMPSRHWCLVAGLLLLAFGAICATATDADLAASPSAAENQLKEQVAALQKSLKDSARQQDSLKATILGLESKLKDVQDRAAAANADAAAEIKAQKDQAAACVAEKEAAENGKRLEEAKTKKKDEQLQKAMEDVSVLSDKLKATDSKLALANAAAKEGNKCAAEKVAVQTKLSECEGRSSKLGKTEAQLMEYISKLEAELELRKTKWDEVTQLWLPPWLVELSEKAQEEALVVWNQRIVPAAQQMRAQTLETIEYTKKASEPHVANFIKSTKEYAKSTQKTVRAHLELAWKRHSEFMAWLAVKNAETQKAMEPHVTAAKAQISAALGQAQAAAAPYAKQASDIITPYYEEAYSAAKPGLDAMHATVLEYWKKASDALAPQLGQLAQVSSEYQKHLEGVVGNITQQVAGAKPSEDVLLFAEVAGYAAIILLPLILAAAFVWPTSFSRNKSKKVVLKGKPVSAGAAHAKKQHPKKHHHGTHTSHGHATHRSAH